MKRVLFLNSKSPFPVRDGAAIGTNQYLRFFHDLGYSVDLAYISENDDLDQVSKGLAGLCSHIYIFKVTKLQSYLSVIKGIFTNRLPLQVNYYYTTPLAKWVSAHQADYDILYCHNMRTTEYAYRLGGYKIWNIVDSLSMNFASLVSESRGLWHYIYKIDAVRCARYEQKMLPVFDKKLIVSAKDCDYIEQQAGHKEKIAVIENFVQVPQGRAMKHDAKARNLVFVGAMNYQPNITAAVYFCHNIMPRLLERYPDLKFYIVGKTPAPSVKALASEHVEVTGWVDDIWSYLEMASVVVTPMQSGSGLQNKILQALAIGACVVTTPIGFEGLVAEEGQPHVAESDDDMVSQISQLLDHPEQRKSEGEKSIGYIRKNYSYEVIRDKFKRFLEE